MVFDNVDFSYAEGKQVLHDVSFRAQPGTVTALVGPSGAGKSTIIGLIAAFYTPVSGRVLVDGIDLSTVRLDSYRTQLGVVLQETFLFDGTIRENVVFSRPEATQEEVNAACRIARVDEFAEAFAEGYNTVVGERGVKLSGGQRQRISIARAILADPRILILDEATSSLDSESEALIQEGLSYLMRGTHHVCDRAPPLHHSQRRPDSGGGSGQDHRARHARIALCAGGRYFELYTKQHGLQANLFLAPGEGDSAGDSGGDSGKNEAAGNGNGSESDSAGDGNDNEPNLARAARLLRGQT